MALTDLPLSELRTYAPDVAEPGDFDAFWAETLDEARRHPTDVRVTAAETPITAFEVLDVTFAGFGGEPIRAWLTRPVGERRPTTIVEYIGYNGGRGIPGERLFWPAAGYAHLLMDSRGQGSGWGSGGATPDPHGSDPAVGGFMTRGIGDPRDYYYRRLITDAVRAVDAVRQLADVDPARIAVAGASQGGGLALAVGGLAPDLQAVMPDVPFLSHLRRSVEITDADPYAEIRRYLAVHRDAVDAAFRTLSYIDGVNFARRSVAPALFSAALMDDIVMPSTVFAAFNAYAGPHEIEVYGFNGHEGGQIRHWLRQVEWLQAL